ENVIALKSLADINERQEKFADAESWLRRLVTVDRSNEEAREQLRRLDERKKTAAEAAPEPVVASAPEPGVASASALEMIDLEPEPSSSGRLPADLEALGLSTASDRPSAEAENREESVGPAPEVTAPEPVETAATVAASEEVSEEPESGEEAVAPVAGLISAEFEPPLEAIGGLGVETSEDVVLEVSGNSEFTVPDASEDFKAQSDRLSTRPQRTPAPALSESGARAGDDRSRTNNEPAPAAIATPRQEEAMLGKPAAGRSYLARETNGRSVASFFHSLLAARPPAEGSAGVPRAGSQAEPASRSAYSAPHGPSATDNSSPEVPAGEQKTDGTVSFDDFFGSEQEGSAPLRQRADPGKDDLDQFQTWLQNLKR
ncbi:MAG TPA: hypothetical protein VGP44_12020, partial [Gemmatimonadales bacterium]|nr:hypothetical protein [Gemmatimonadales bacterium]